MLHCDKIHLILDGWGYGWGAFPFLTGKPYLKDEGLLCGQTSKVDLSYGLFEMKLQCWSLKCSIVIRVICLRNVGASFY